MDLVPERMKEILLLLFFIMLCYSKKVQGTRGPQQIMSTVSHKSAVVLSANFGLQIFEGMYWGGKMSEPGVDRTSCKIAKESSIMNTFEDARYNRVGYTVVSKLVEKPMPDAVILTCIRMVTQDVE